MPWQLLLAALFPMARASPVRTFAKPVERLFNSAEFDATPPGAEAAAVWLVVLVEVLPSAKFTPLFARAIPRLVVESV